MALPHSATAARRLGIDFAPCMTGFDRRAGRSVPRIEGVIVAAENAEAVREAAVAAAERARERAEIRAREEALERWRDLLRRVVARKSVQRKYGDFSNADFDLEAERAGSSAKKIIEPASAGSDAQRNDDVAMTAPKKDGAVRAGQRVRGGSANDGHEHLFDDERHHADDIWIKVCSTCGIEVPYERL